MKALLVAANQCTTPYPVYPLGLDYVRQSLAPQHETRLVDLCAAGEAAIQCLADALDEFRPDAVGLSLRNIDNTDAAAPQDFTDHYRRVAAEIRACSRAKLVLGGSAFNLFPAEMMELTGADYGILGEGERVAPLLTALERGDDPGPLAGVVCPGRPPVYPEPFDGPIAAAMPDDLPAAYYLRRGGMLNLQTKRGCPFDCLYCTYPLIEGRRLRRFAPAEVAAHAAALQHAGAKFLFVADSSFNADVSHSLEVAAAFRGRGVAIPWGAFLTPLPTPADYYRRLRDSGLTHVEFGTDALADAPLRTCRKPFSADDVYAAHAAALAAGLHVAHYFALGGPGETRQTLDATLDNAERLSRGVFFFLCGMRIYPGAGLHSLAVREGQIAPTDRCFRPTFYQPRDLDLAAVRDRVIQRAAGRRHWVIGAGDDGANRAVARLHAHGHIGPLWEKLLW